MAVQMKDEIIRSGVAHSVETSRLTNNAVNPRNTFMDVADEASIPTPPTQDLTPVARSIVEFDKTPDTIDSKGVTPEYPVKHSSLNTREKLSEAKSHIKDNIQALHELAHLDNKQLIGSEQFSSNYQSTGPVEHIKDHVVYLEKKSIRENRQKTPQSTERASPELAVRKNELPASPNKVLRSKAPSPDVHSVNNTEDRLSARMRQIKADVRTVKNSLSDIEDDEDTKPL